jgi:PAS domain S-box-containing protein
MKKDGKNELKPEKGALEPSREAVEPSVLQLREIIDEAGDGFYETDNHGNFRDFNNSLCNVLGYPREEIQGRNFAIFMDDRPARKLSEAMNRVWVSHQGFSNLI